MPVFPQFPELIHELDERDIREHESVLRTGKRHWPANRILKTMRGWMLPYFKSRILPADFQPIIAYLFTEWKCNLDCHYCWSYDNRVKGMTEDTARRAIDWLHSTPCRVLAPTGGEPLLRPDFVHKVVYYATKKDFWVYLATNARLLCPNVTDRLADAGIATINFAVDTVKEKPGLPKALERVRRSARQRYLHHVPYQRGSNDGTRSLQASWRVNIMAWKRRSEKRLNRLISNAQQLSIRLFTSQRRLGGC
jgi:MoaA/NifB/PqqE/SkfB family radical SAM enzyme